MKLNAEGTLENPFIGCRRCKAGNCEYLSVQSITAAESLRRKDRDEEAFFVLISFVLKFSGAAKNGSFFLPLGLTVQRLIKDHCKEENEYGK